MLPAGGFNRTYTETRVVLEEERTETTLGSIPGILQILRARETNLDTGTAE